MTLTFGIRKSLWALAAANSLIDKASKLRDTPEIQITELDTPGDLDHSDLAKLGGTTSFVDALSIEVAAGNIDCAVHTIKDITWPKKCANLPEGTYLKHGIKTTGDLFIAAVTKRSDPRDTIVFRQGEDFDNLKRLGKKPIKVGTSSLLRAESSPVLI